MLPDVRLIIAAPFASIMALGCGFGMFAALHVSQEPLRRMPFAPLQLVAINSAAPVTSIVAAAPFDNRLQIGESGGGVSALAYAAPEPAEQPAANAVPAGADREHEASEPAVPAPETTAATAIHPAEVSTTEPRTKVPEGRPDETAADRGDVAPLAPIVARLQPPAAEPANTAPAPVASEQTRSQAATIEPETSVPEPAKISPVPPTKAASEPPAKSADKETREAKDKETKETKKTRVAARTRHARVAHLAGGDAAFELPDFRAPGNWPTETAENASVKHRRATAVSSAAAATNAGIGGPFVRAPDR